MTGLAVSALPSRAVACLVQKAMRPAISSDPMVWRKTDMQEDTLSFIIVAIAFVTLAMGGGACLAAALYASNKTVRVLLTMLGCSTVIVFTIIYAQFR